MNRFVTATAVLLTSTALAHAGGLDRAGFNLSPIFEDGDYFELSFSLTQPSVSGSWPTNGADSGNMAQDYMTYGFAYRTDLDDQVGLAIVFDQPFGAAITYENADAPFVLGLPPSGYPLSGFNATLTANSAAAYLSYDLGNGFSVYGGLRYVTMAAEINFLSGGNTGAGAITIDQTVTYPADAGIGHTLGVAYEIPDIALRANLTYHSATRHENSIETDVGPTAQGPGATTTGEYMLPQIWALDFQTGIAEGTLLIAGVRWTDWSESVLPTFTSLGTIENDDVHTYTLGLARRFTEDFAMLGRLTYEASSGDDASNLAPTDGNLGLTVAGIFTIDNVDITAGVNFTQLGDATTELLGAEFTDNYAMGAGVRVGVSF